MVMNALKLGFPNLRPQPSARPWRAGCKPTRGLAHPILWWWLLWLRFGTSLPPAGWKCLYGCSRRKFWLRGLTQCHWKWLQSGKMWIGNDQHMVDQQPTLFCTEYKKGLAAGLQFAGPQPLPVGGLLILNLKRLAMPCFNIHNNHHY